MGIICDGKNELSVEWRTASFTIMDKDGDTLELYYSDYLPLIELLEENKIHINFEKEVREFKREKELGLSKRKEQESFGDLTARADLGLLSKKQSDNAYYQAQKKKRRVD